MAKDTGGGERNHPATPRRKKKARDSGKVALSRDFSGALAFMAAGSVIFIWGQSSVIRLGNSLAAFLGRVSLPGMAGWPTVQWMLTEAAWAALPTVLAALLVGSATVLLQTRFLVHMKAVSFQLSRINPVTGAKRLFGWSGLIEALKSIIKVLLIGSAFYYVLNDKLWRLSRAYLYGWQVSAALIMTLLQDIMIAAGAAFLIAGVLDLGLVHYRHARDLRMNRRDLRDEYKDTEGDPLTKGRLRQMAFSQTRRRLRDAMKTATVVVTNPTHYAVALAYDRNANAAPIVVAKGVDFMAAKIRELAKESNVPVVANPPLARALYPVALDTEVPAEHYKVVAEIIAYVWKLKHGR